MKKLNNEQRTIVDACRQQIAALQTEQDKVFGAMVEQLGSLADGTEDWIFDYVYNTNVNPSDEYLDYVKDKLFEQ